MPSKIPNTESLPYRDSTQAIILNLNKDKVLLVQSIAYDENQWNFPGGGIEEAETPQQAISRELEEELNTNKFKFLQQHPSPHTYDWNHINILDRYKKTGKWFKGQTKHVFLFQFTGESEKINIDSSELKNYKWVPLNELESHLIFPNQYFKAKKYLKDFSLPT